MPTPSPSPLRTVALAGAILGLLACVVFWFWPLREGTPPSPGLAADTAIIGDATTAAALLSPPSTEVPAAVRTEATLAAPLATTTAANDHTAPAAPGIDVHGRVVDVRGNAIAGALVAPLDVGKAGPIAIAGVPRELLAVNGVKTDAEGRFTLFAPPDTTALLATHDLHPPSECRCEVGAPRTADVLIVMPDGGTIGGRIVGAPPDAGALSVVARKVETGVAALVETVRPQLIDLGDLLEGLELPIGGRLATVAGDGTFELHGLEHGARYRVNAFRQTSGAGRARCTEVVEVAIGAAGIVLPWRASIDLVLTVVDAESGGAIEDLEVEVGPVRRMSVGGMSVAVPMRSRVPDRHFPGGLVELRGLGVDSKDGGVLAIEVRSKGKQPWSRDDVAVSRPGRIDLGVVCLASAPIVRVVVTAVGLPIAGAEVTVAAAPMPDGEAEPRRSIRVGTSIRTGGTTEATNSTRTNAGTTDAAGIAEVTTALAGSARVVVRAEGFAPVRGPVFPLPPRGVVDQAIALTPGGTVVVTTVDGHGQPLAAATVRRRATDGADESSVLTSDQTGVARFSHLAPGEHTFELDEEPAKGLVRMQVTAGSAAPKPGSRTVTLSEGERAEVRLVQPLRGQLRGVVTLDGRPLEGAELKVELRSDDSLRPDAAAEAAASAAVESLLGGVFGSASDRIRTDDAGAFELPSIPVGPIRATVRHDDLAMPATVDLTLVEGANHHDFLLRATAVRGRVLGHDGSPLSGASVSAAVAATAAAPSGERVEAVTRAIGEMFGASLATVRADDDGTFELRGVRAGIPLRIQASARQHVPNACEIPPVPEGTIHDGVELRLAGAGRVRVRAPADGALAVTAHWAGDPAQRPATTTHTAILKAGRATLDGLAAGSWRVELDGTGNAKGRQQTVAVAIGQTANVEF